MTLVSANEPKKSKRMAAKCDLRICLGCGLCARRCDRNAIDLKRLPQRTVTPLNGAHKAVYMAIERGKLQDLIFDNRILGSHRALAVLLGVILRLPPMKQLLANRQLKSRYVEKLMSRVKT
jgi:ferredoxin